MGGESLDGYKIDGKFAIAVGNEANGITENLKSKGDVVIKIPMEERSESLNVAIASSIMMYALKQ